MNALSHAICFALTLVTSAGQVSSAPQAKPDFSGEWVLAGMMANPGSSGTAVAENRGGIYGERFTAKQTAATLSMELSVAVLPGPLLVVYALDGSESKNMNPSQVPGGEDEPIYSRATWAGGTLIIDTRGTRLVNGKPQTSRRVLSLTPDGLLQVERSAEGQQTTRSFYKRLQE
jgi:hypothetical protein